MQNDRILAALKTAFAHYESNDRGPLDALLADDFHFEMSDSLPYGGVYVGPDEFAAFWKEVAKEWQYFRYEAHEIIDAGDTILVPVRTDALSIRGIRMRNEHLFLFKVRDGKVIFGRLYADTARGRDVLEGREPRRYPRATLADCQTRSAQN
ncbi:nuclear transport factor 2 family protein [Streptomyces sp. NPDC047042]|uniref:nuclear transport factor 2 family protein n=1 Tax=Streptomyces sp. NPDC047042 TaxID=3154807 RepID=UPI0033D519A5